MFSVSARLVSVPASPIRKLVPFAQEAKKNGVTVYHLNIGDPDIKTPKEMLSVLTTWDRPTIGYSLSQGEPAFIDSVTWYYHHLGYSFINAANIQITSGGSEGILFALFAVTQPGDEVLVFEPFYANYNTYAAINGITLVPVPTSIADGFHLPDTKDIEAKITKKTKAILICSPNNPTGTVFSKKEMDTLVSLAKKHKLFLLADEVYREFTYDGKTQVSLLSYMQDIPNQAIVLDSLSKRYSLCGARLGMIVSLNAEIMAGVLRMAMGRLSSGLIDQLMAAKLTEVPATYFAEVHAEYEKRRDILYAGLSRIPGVSLPKPEGAFYSIVKLPVEDSEAFCKWLLTDFRDNNETVMFAPAAGFYATPRMGKNEVRVAYVLAVPKLKRCIDLLAKALNQYNKN